jgi:citrate lyase subunit beta-like protein
VDCIALDCEDGVAINRKSAARETIHKFFNANNHLPIEQTEWSVRINSVASDEHNFDEDMRCILASSKLPTTLLLPKVESTDDLDLVSIFL